jgi:hypothetical protein
MSDKGEVSDGRWEIYLAQKEAFDAITEIPDSLHIILDTSSTPEESTYKALQKMRNFDGAVTERLLRQGDQISV